MIIHNALTSARKSGTQRSSYEAWCYFLLGQSNAKGLALLTGLPSELQGTIPKSYVYYKPNAEADSDAAFSTDNGFWTPLSETWDNVNNPIAFGPERRFAYEMQNYLGREIFIIKVAKADTALSAESTAGVVGSGGLLDWSPTTSVNELYKRAITHYWGIAKAKLIAMGRVPIAKGGLWMQGERDTNYTLFASSYYDNCVALLSSFRTDFGNPTMHWSIGRISDDVRNAAPFGVTVYNAQQSLGGLPYNDWIDTDAYTMAGDGVHYADPSQLGMQWYLNQRDL